MGSNRYYIGTDSVWSKNVKVSIKVKPNAKKESVEDGPDGWVIVSVKAPAAEGKANVAVIKTLAKHFGVSQSHIKIVSGASARTKRVEIAE